MQKVNIKNFYIVFCLLFVLIFDSYGKPLKDFDDKMEVLYIAKIIDDKENLDSEVLRSDFAKMIVMASVNKDKATSYSSLSVCNDVGSDTKNANHIKMAIENSYMVTYLGGLFKPNEYVKYSDLSRASLALLGYKDSDFVGNKVIDRNRKFESLILNEGIEKANNDILTKRDVINGIYNTLKEKIKDSNNVYGLTIFSDMVLDKDNELNATGMIDVNVRGPFFVKNEKELSIHFETNDYNVYLNGVLTNLDEVKYDIYNYGYAIYYLDDKKDIVYAYTERDDIAAPIRLIKGYVQNIYYNANDFTTPYRVDIDLHKFSISSEEMKFAFSSSGSFKIDDYIVVLCNKMNDVNKAYLNSSGNIEYGNDESEPYNGSIVNAFHTSLIK